eukprot:TRINITY_DN2215_c0_g8_i1.p1 TRINITY_DN2215_c0_g8~~TRINITY_DN2215_c0_g8_i1.p1  ORF type:complete len:181 (-),score=19.27 TRINITY_DN2215_c0_g8_i1:322-864(-)
MRRSARVRLSPVNVFVSVDAVSPEYVLREVRELGWVTLNDVVSFPANYTQEADWAVLHPLRSGDWDHLPEPVTLNVEVAPTGRIDAAGPWLDDAVDALVQYGVSMAHVPDCLGAMAKVFGVELKQRPSMRAVSESMERNQARLEDLAGVRRANPGLGDPRPSGPRPTETATSPFMRHAKS